MGVDSSGMNKDMASAAIRLLKDRAPATTRQITEVRRLVDLDDNVHAIPPHMTQASACELITKLRANQKTTAKQREVLEQRGVPPHRIPELFVDASKMLTAMHTRKRRRDDLIAAALKDASSYTQFHAQDVFEGAMSEDEA